MWLKILIGVLFLMSLLGAFVLAPQRPQGDAAGAPGNQRRDRNRRHLRLLSWNIGNANLEPDTRALAKDLPAVAQVIRDNDPDVVAIQELASEAQLEILLAQLDKNYRGYACSPGSADRVNAVLVRNAGAGKSSGKNQTSTDRVPIFNNVPAGDGFAAALTVRRNTDLPEVVLVSAHADAFSASRRRRFVAEVVDWSRSRAKNQVVFIAGDFNLEVSVRSKTDLFTDDAKHDSEAYSYLLKYFRDLGRETGATSINDRRIDYIFGPETVLVERAEVLRGAAVGRMDHWPLLVEVKL